MCVTRSIDDIVCCIFAILLANIVVPFNSHSLQFSSDIWDRFKFVCLSYIMGEGERLKSIGLLQCVCACAYVLACLLTHSHMLWAFTFIQYESLCKYQLPANNYGADSQKRTSNLVPTARTQILLGYLQAATYHVLCGLDTATDTSCSKYCTHSTDHHLHKCSPMYSAV